jgi:hypothetical protein
MNDEITAVIAMLEAAKSLPPDEARATVDQAINRLIEVVKKVEAPDVDKGS